DNDDSHASAVMRCAALPGQGGSHGYFTGLPPGRSPTRPHPYCQAPGTCKNWSWMEEFHCSFCGKQRREVRKLISGPRVFICDQCVTLCNDILAKEEASERPKYPPPRAIVEELDRYVVGQKDAKRAMSV